MHTPIDIFTNPTYSNILRLSAVMKSTGLSRSSVYALMKRNEFPRSINLGIRGVGWLEEEVTAWKAARIAARLQ